MSWDRLELVRTNTVLFLAVKSSERARYRSGKIFSLLAHHGPARLKIQLDVEDNDDELHPDDHWWDDEVDDNHNGRAARRWRQSAKALYKARLDLASPELDVHLEIFDSEREYLLEALQAVADIDLDDPLVAIIQGSQDSDAEISSSGERFILHDLGPVASQHGFHIHR